MTVAIVVFFWVLSAAFMFWIGLKLGLKLGQNLSQKNYDDFEL